MTRPPSRHPHLPGPRDEQGSVLLVILMILFITIVSITVVTGSINQLGLSQNLQTRNDYLQAALAGNQAVLGEVRAAATGGSVVATSLPCSADVGRTNATGGMTYSATIQYYAENASGSYTAVSCTPGLGPQLTGTGNYLSSAVITSCAPLGGCPTGNGSGGALWRRVVSTYTFETNNNNIAGGLIYTGSSDTQCLVASYNNGTSPAGGMTLDVTSSCANGNSEENLEQFQYTTDWTLEISVDGSDYCVQDPEDLPSPGTNPVLPLGTCSASAVDQWGVNDSEGIQAVSTSTTPSGTPGGWCLTNPDYSDTEAPGYEWPAALLACSNGNTNGFIISAQVGSGGAQPASGTLIGVTQQLVNYQEFGRCLDVTNQNVSQGFLINYPCKQFPDTVDYPIWNQRWCFDQLGSSGGNLEGVLYTPYLQSSCSHPTNPYCLQSPLSLTTYVVVAQCTLSNLTLTSVPTGELWTAWAGNGGALHSYNWTDTDGYCLTADPDSTYASWSTIWMKTCSGAYDQKWNAPPTLTASQVSNTHELIGSNTAPAP